MHRCDCHNRVDISRQTAYELVQRGEIGAVRLGGRKLVSPVELERLIGERPPPPDQISQP